MSERITFEGHVNQFVPPNRIIGWAVNINNPENAKLSIAAKLDERNAGICIADLHREDLERYGSGNYAFDLACTEDIPYNSILSGHVSIEVRLEQTVIGNLYFDDMTKDIVSALEISRLFQRLNNSDATTLHAVLNHALPHIGPPVADLLRGAFTLLKNYDVIPSVSRFVPGSISNLFFKTGILSSDRSAMLGQDGHLFLVEGSNNVNEIFSKHYDDKDALETAANWFNLISKRLELVSEQNAAFIQMIIPEKISIARELLDGNMSAPSAALAALEQKISSSLKPENYISGLASLGKLPFGSAFRKIDTHLTPIAAFSIARKLCAMIGYNIAENIPFDIPVTVHGDISRRFFGHELYEVCYLAKEPHFKSGLKLISSQHPPDGGYIGKRYVLKNDKAPIQKKVVLFGNSFFDNHIFQGSVSYWMSIWFTEYHFIFSPEMDLEYIDKVKPDIVICQTIERFLDSIPDS